MDPEKVEMARPTGVGHAVGVDIELTMMGAGVNGRRPPVNSATDMSAFVANSRTDHDLRPPDCGP
jgi:hypothetical protein